MENPQEITENQGNGARAQNLASEASDEVIELAEYDLMAEDELSVEDYLLAAYDLESSSIDITESGSRVAPPQLPLEVRQQRESRQRARQEPSRPETRRRPSFFQRMREIWGSPHPAQR